jgi:hypothetical protein
MKIGFNVDTLVHARVSKQPAKLVEPITQFFRRPSVNFTPGLGVKTER